MVGDLSVMRLVQGQRQDVFNYFVRPELLEQWAYPKGMKLRLPFMEAKIGGGYRFEHTGKDGLYVATGNFSDFQPGSKLVQIEKVIGPGGNAIFPRIETVTTFSQKPGGTFITITQKGFADEKSLKECEIGWNESLDNLAALFASKSMSASAAKEDYMFNKTFSAKKFFPVDRKLLFKYWIRPDLLEKWSSPKGTELKILYLEEKSGGKFHYRYHVKEEVYDLNGHIGELVPNEKIVMIDSLKDPNGKVVYENQTTTMNFKSVPGGTEVSIQQEGFPNEEYFKMNEENWNLGVNNLSNLISSESKRAAA